MNRSRDKKIQQALTALSSAHHAANVATASSAHPFPARMPLPLAEHLIDALASKRCNVLDPMSGSGSILVAARRLGHVAYGVDIDPLAVLISRVATASHRRKPLEELGERILSRARQIRTRMPRTSVPTLLSCTDEEKLFLRYWFPLPAQRELYSLAEAIRDETGSAQQNLAWVAFSSLIISKQTSVSYAVDIARSRPHKDDDREIELPFAAWTRRFGQLVNRLPFLDQEINTLQPKVERGDVRSLCHDSDFFDLVLTSPPYLNAIDYLRGHKFSLLWMGHSLSWLRTTRGRMIGTERGMWKPNGLPPVLEADLEEDINEDQVRALKRRYLSDLRYALLEMKRVVRPRGLIAMVLGPNLLGSCRPDAVDVMQVLAESAGLNLVASVLRPLHGERRSLPPPRSVPMKSTLAKRISREAIVVFRKE